MRQKIAVAPLAFWKSAEKFQDPFPEINWQRQDRAQLNHDRVHLPEAVAQIEMEQCLDDAEMSGRAHRQTLRQAFDDTKLDRQQEIVHETASPPPSSVRTRIASSTSLPKTLP